MTEGAKRYAQGVPTISGEFAENGTIFRSLLPTPSAPATPGHLKVNCPEGAREAALGCPYLATAKQGRLRCIPISAIDSNFIQCYNKFI